MSFQLVAFTKELQIRKLHQWHFSIPLQETWLVYAASLLTVNAGSKASWISGSQGIVYLRLKTVSLQGIQGFSTCQTLKTTNKYLPYFPSSGLWCQHIPARLIPPVGDVLNDQPHVCFTVFPSFGPYTRNLSQALFGMTPGWLPPCHWKATTGICMLTSSQPANPS